MPEPVTDLVLADTHAVVEDRGDHFLAIGVETGLYMYGPSREEALALLREATRLLIVEWKKQGAEVLDEQMKSRGISYKFIAKEEVSA